MLNTKQPPMIEFRKQVTERLQNGRELSRDIRFEELLEVLYSSGLCGLDFRDVYRAVNGQHATLISFIGEDFSKLANAIEDIKRAKGLIIAIKIPRGWGIKMVDKIREQFLLITREDAIILHQAVHHSRDYVKVILLYY